MKFWVSSVLAEFCFDKGDLFYGEEMELLKQSIFVNLVKCFS